MSATHRRRDTCRMCGSRKLEMVLPLAATPVGDAYVPAEHLDKAQETYPLNLWLCGECGLTQLVDIVDPKVLYVEYVYYTSISLGLVEHFRRYAEDAVKRIQLPEGSLVVDIGSNDGSLLMAFRNQGMKVLGIDPARDVAKLANERGIETLNTFFGASLARTLRRERGPSALITANNVFANVDDVDDLVEGVREWLAPEGVFVFETSYLGDVMEKTLLETVFHEHISYFSVKPLISFFRRHGMEVVEVQRQPTKGGSIRVTVKLAAGERPVSPSVAEIVAHEDSLRLHHPQIFRRFSARIAAVKDDLHRHICDLKRRGSTIAGYGASVGVVTLLYEFGLKDFLSFIVDDNERKQNTFSPGQHIPVYAPAALYEREADAVVVLAWLYAGPIMKKHPKFFEKDGQFIIPLPSLNVVKEPVA